MDDPVPALPVIAEPGLQEIGEKDKFQQDEYDENLDQDYDPKLFACGHVPETIQIKGIYTVDDLQGRLFIFRVKNT